VTSLRIFFVGGVISYRALFGFLHPAVFIPTMLVVPVFQVLLFAYIGRSAGVANDQFYVIGNGIHNASLPCLWAMTHAVAGERFQQTLGYILASPARRVPLFLGRALPVVANGFLIAIFALVVGGAVLGVTFAPATLASIAVVTMVSAFSCTGMGLVNAALGLVIREIAVLSNILFGLLLVFTGANVPLDVLPDWLATLSHGLPIRHGIQAARELADGASLGDVRGLIGAEALVGAVYGVFGFGMIRAFELLSRRRATLEIS
jgi:ABC-2 type transport system permease protein